LTQGYKRLDVCKKVIKKESDIYLTGTVVFFDGGPK